MRKWWAQIYSLLTCCGDDIITGNVRGSRHDVTMMFLGHKLDHTRYGETLEGMLATMMQVLS